MKKNISKKDLFIPLPVLIVGTYDGEKKPNALTAAWGTLHDLGEVFICLSSDHKTTKNIHINKEFTVSFATVDKVAIADYFGIVSGEVENKILISKVKTIPSERVNAPLFEEFPLSLECKLKKIDDDGQTAYVVGEIVNVVADESILTNNSVDIDKLKPIIFNSANNSYHVLGDKVADAFSIGKKVKHE